MRLSFLLAQLAGYDPNPHRRTGLIKEISEYTHIYRHKVRDLLKGDFQSLKLEDLGKICKYLVEKHGVPLEKLPAALFAVEPDHLWEQLARRDRLQFSFGVRREEGMSERSWVMASDAMIYGVLLGCISGMGSTAARLPTSPNTGDGDATNGGHGASEAAALAVEAVGGQANGPRLRFPAEVVQSMVRAPSGLNQAGDGPLREEPVVAMARETYDGFLTARKSKSKALVCLGSIKSNPVCEMVFANAFGLEPFAEQPNVKEPGDRHCPLYMRYRDNDPKPASCVGGMRLSKKFAGDTPGIWYETASGDWECAPWVPNRRDVAIVYYVVRPPLGRIELVLGGYSGLATRLLAGTLAENVGQFWPPADCGSGVQIGAFIVQYEFHITPGVDQGFLYTPPLESMSVTRLADEVFQRRIAHVDDQGNEG